MSSFSGAKRWKSQSVKVRTVRSVGSNICPKFSVRVQSQICGRTVVEGTSIVADFAGVQDVMGVTEYGVETTDTAVNARIDISCSYSIKAQKRMQFSH
jgi:hypothetical protein